MLLLECLLTAFYFQLCVSNPELNLWSRLSWATLKIIIFLHGDFVNILILGVLGGVGGFGVSPFSFPLSFLPVF